MLLSPGAAYTYNGERRRYPYIELVYWSGGNPFHHHQDLARLRRAFRAVSTVVVHEPYWTATARHADIVLPATVTLERDDIGAARTDPYLTAMHRHAPPFAQARDDYAIFSELAERLGCGRGVHRGARRRGWLRHIYEQWRRAATARRRPGLRQLLAHGTGRARPVARRSAFFADFRADPAAHPLRHAERADRAASRRRSPAFGLADCPGHPAWLEPGEWHGAARAAAYPLRAARQQPVARACTASWTSARTAPRARSPGASRCGCTPTTPPPAGSPTATWCACSTTAAPAWRACASSRPTCCRAWCRCRRAPGSPRSMTPAARRCCARRATSTCSPPTSARRAVSQGCAGARALVEVQRWEGDVPPVASAGPPPVRGG